MARVRNDFGEDRVVPTAPFFYGTCPAGHTFEVADEDALHWAAGGWTVLDPYPVPAHLIGNHPDGRAYVPDADGLATGGIVRLSSPIDRSADTVAGEELLSQSPATFPATFAEMPPPTPPAPPVPPAPPAPAEPAGEPS